MKFTNSFRKIIVAICSSLIFCIIMGTIRLNSQLFVVVREMFGTDREQASFPFTLQYAVRNLSGPFIGFVGNKFGLRCTSVFGCLLSSVSLAACFLAKDIICFTILWGIAFGIGFGLSTLLLQKILQLYFTKSFNLIQGIFLSGGSIGSFVFPGVGEYLLLTYGTSGTFLILSGFVLHTVPLAMLLECPETAFKMKSHIEVQEKGETFEMTKDTTTMEEENGSKYVCLLNSEDVLSKKHYCCEDEKSGGIDVSSLPNSNFNNAYTRNKYCRSSNSAKFEHKNVESDLDVPPKQNEQTKSLNFISRNFKVFFDPAYILVCISIGLVLVSLAVLHTMMVDAWRDKGVSEDVAILMTFAIADLVGRLGFGFLSDLKCTSPLNMYALTSGICALLLIGFPWLNEFYAIVVFFAVVGVLMGGIMVTTTGVIRDYIEKDNLTMAFSSQYFLLGLLNLSQPPVIGYFRETLQSYDGLFYFKGSLCIFGTVISLCVPMAARYRDKRKK